MAAIIKVRDENGDVINIPAFVGPKGDPGADYVLTEADKAEIAELAAELVEVPEGGGADLTGYATEQWVREGYQPKGDYLTEHQSLDEYAKTSEIPTKPEDIGALPSTTKIPAKTSELTNDSGFITGYTETDPTVPAWAKNSSKPSYSKSEVGLGNVDNVKQYSASNPPPYPVTSVNGKTGAVTITVPTVPTKVSAFANDAGYITQAQVPAKGVDYWTEADQEEIVQQVIAALGTPVFGRVDANNNIILTGNLEDGTYTVQYEDADGNVVDVGTIGTIEVSPYVPLTFYKGKINSDGSINSTDNTYMHSNEVVIENGAAYTLHHDALAVSIKLSMWDASGNFLSTTTDLYNTSNTGQGAHDGNIGLNQYFVSGAAKFRLRIYVYDYANIATMIDNCNNGAITVTKE